MCTYAIAFQAHPDYPLILVGNRDEFFNRPTAPAHFWQDAPGLFAGEDLIHHGTWLGIHKNGRFACLSNYRHLGHEINLRKKVLSRGLVVRDLLMSEKTIVPVWKQKLLDLGQQCQGFSLLCGELLEHACLYYFTNITNEWKPLEPGIYSMSNNLLTDKPWPKACFLQRHLQQLLQQKLLNKADILTTALELLADRSQQKESVLPTYTGFPLEIEKQLSSVFVRMPLADFNYGTRASTVLIVDRNYQVFFYEKTFEDPDDPGHLKQATFSLIQGKK